MSDPDDSTPDQPPAALSAPDSTGSHLTNLQLRILSAVVLATMVLSLTWLGGGWFRLLAVILGAAIIYEWLLITKPGQAAGAPAVAVVAVAALLLLAGAAPSTILLLAAAAPLATLIGSRGLEAGSWAAAGTSYAVLSLASLAWLRGDDSSGFDAIIFLFAVVWATDILAYFAGRSIGGPKLAPSISPNKTWSGAIGGAVGGIAAGAAFSAFAGADFVLMTIVSFALSVIAQFGDLFESWVKRRHGAKDSSNLIPGHGGVMDRVDGLVAAALGLYVLGAALADPLRPSQAFFPG